MIINITLLGLILLYLLFAIYDQFIMDKRYGKTELKVRLLRKLKIESIVMLLLIWIAVYQALPQGLETVTIYLLVMLSILLIYHAFIRYPVFLLKQEGFFLNNLYIPYQHIQTINISENGFLQIVLKNNKQLPVYIDDVDDVAKVLQFLVKIGRITQPIGGK
ncbi:MULTISPECIES: YobD family protein [Gallibacterium]|uniref:UPF0266 membrane protein YobD n=1 Tax=Gallibacterium genomosp. 3 TaxID=505345 RepID=A0A1A7Q045_9PAST|nr:MULTISPECIES: DUF986 family protein [Gallibacterium]MDA3979354.1 DUF986 family protein [Gallibacterium sp. AGMB14963]OBW90653.1 hypothetical protein QV01_10015 [Gallibacterium genomosp. 3]OBX07639.1 hypothetical protein QV07_06705 [Gallibacterium genomosp. 3]